MTMTMTQKQAAVNNFLDLLRISGATNMFGATPFIQQRFPEMSRKEAIDALVEWMETFEKRHGTKSE